MSDELRDILDNAGAERLGYILAFLEGVAFVLEHFHERDGLQPEDSRKIAEAVEQWLSERGQP